MQKQVVFKSWIYYYLSIMIFALILCVTTELGLKGWVFNHFFFIIASNVELFRIKRHFKRKKFNVHDYIKSRLVFSSDIVRIPKNESVEKSICEDIKKYTFSYHSLNIACLVNIISVFWLLQFVFKNSFV